MIHGELAVATIAQALHEWYPPAPRWVVTLKAVTVVDITDPQPAPNPQPEVHPMWQRLARLTPPEPVRAWFYRVSTVAGPLLIAYGAVEDTRWALWLALIQTALGFGMAGANSSTKA